MSKVILQGYIIVPETELVKVTKALKLHKRLTRKETGCLIFEVTQDKNNANKFNVYEEFTNQDAFNIHQTRVKQSHWGEVTQNVQRHYSISHVT